MGLRIGIDLDNTLISYDEVFARLAAERGWSPSSETHGKKAIRDAVRKTAGNDAWTALQAEAYGPRMNEAVLMPGAVDFLEWVTECQVPVFVVSHKTRRSAAGGYDLHGPAVEWMRSRAFFSPKGLGLKPGEGVFLEETREAKTARIAGLGLTHFIDDLEEFLVDPGFPVEVQRIHYAPEGEGSREAGVIALSGWDEILRYFEAARRCG